MFAMVLFMDRVRIKGFVVALLPLGIATPFGVKGFLLAISNLDLYRATDRADTSTVCFIDISQAMRHGPQDKARRLGCHS